MPAIALSDVLTDFGLRGGPAQAAIIASVPGAGAAPGPRLEQKPVLPPRPDVGDLIAAEVKRAESALELRLQVEHGAAMQAERQKHAAELAALAESFGTRTGEALSGRLSQLGSEAADSVTAAVARILGTVVGEDIRKRSLESLAAAVAAAFSGNEAIRISAIGPAPMLAALRTSLGDDLAARLDAAETEGSDITVDIDGSVIETRLADWADTLAEILA